MKCKNCRKPYPRSEHFLPLLRRSFARGLISASAARRYLSTHNSLHAASSAACPFFQQAKEGEGQSAEMPKVRRSAQQKREGLLHLRRGHAETAS